jgi:hypothetical protein
MDKIYEMLKSNDFEINVLGARLLIDMAGNNIIKFVNLVDTYEIENKDKAIFERTKSFTDYTIHGFSNYKVEYRANRVTFNGLESNPNNITLTRMGEEIV